MSIPARLGEQVRNWAVAVCTVAITACLCLLLLDMRNLVKAQFGVAQRESEKTRELIERQTVETRRAALAVLERQAARSTDQLVKVLDARSGQIAESATALQAEARDAIHDARPALANAALIARDVHAALEPAVPKFVGMAANASTLMEESALTAHEWRRETPAIAGNLSRISGNVEKATRPHWYWKAAGIAGGALAGWLLARH